MSSSSLHARFACIEGRRGRAAAQLSKNNDPRAPLSTHTYKHPGNLVFRQRVHSGVLVRRQGSPPPRAAPGDPEEWPLRLLHLVDPWRCHWTREIIQFQRVVELVCCRLFESIDVSLHSDREGRTARNDQRQGRGCLGQPKRNEAELPPRYPRGLRGPSAASARHDVEQLARMP